LNEQRVEIVSIWHGGSRRTSPSCRSYWGEIQIFAGGEGESDVAGGEGEADVAGGETQSDVAGGEGEADGSAVVVSSVTSTPDT
jgi:hypothetical protein